MRRMIALGAVLGLALTGCSDADEGSAEAQIDEYPQQIRVSIAARYAEDLQFADCLADVAVAEVDAGRVDEFDVHIWNDEFPLPAIQDYLFSVAEAAGCSPP